MSVRSHAPDCAKTVALNSGDYDDEGPVSCTCGAEYVRGVPTLEEAAYQSGVIDNFHRGHNADQETIAGLRAEVAEARRLAEKWRNGCLLEFGFVGSAAKHEEPLPWEAGS